MQSTQCSTWSFIEHRWLCGQLVQFLGGAGPDSLQKDPSFLSIEQALADFATLIYHVKDKFEAEDSAVIAFGGSYGGMLAAWLRKKYPNAVQVSSGKPGRYYIINK